MYYNFTYDGWINSCEYGIRKLINNGGIRDCINTKDVASYLTHKDRVKQLAIR